MVLSAERQVSPLRGFAASAEKRNLHGFSDQVHE
jgi:hypothetical protein